MTRDETRDMFVIGPFPQKEHDAPALSRLQHNPQLKRGARIQRSAELPGEARLLHRRRLRQHTITADEGAAIPCHRDGRFTRVRERHVVCPFLVVGISRQDRTRGGVELRDHVTLMAVARRPERPLVVCEDAERSGAFAVVPNCQH